MVLRQLDIHRQKDEAGPLPHTIYKNYLKLDQRPLRAKTIKLLEENIGVNLLKL